MNIGFIGNFVPSFSTENDRKWSMLQLGHNVITYQENESTIEDLQEGLLAKKFDILFYSHTHGWEIPDLKEFFAECKDVGVPTVSVHLDRWAWLERVKDVGKEATWFTEFMFMADCSPEAIELYRKNKVNYYYLKPAVVARDCYIAKPDHEKYPHEIVFLGSKGYHPEYKFRPELIEWLHKEYGKRFGHYGNDGIEVVRGKALNKVLSSAKIVIGDSIFGGRPNYVSDRYYETRGRGGLLLHPKVEGVDHEGVIFYDKQSLKSLKEAIMKVLDMSNDERNAKRDIGFNWVKNNETHTHRIKEILKIVFPKKQKK